LGTTETIRIDASLCTGCRACELACGFRWTKEMDPSRACISVRRDEAGGRMKIAIRECCDVCRNLEVPFCIQVCQPRALSLGRKLVWEAVSRSGRRGKKGVR
jgi:Fe-S-cluster-containing dehydrogenase component